MAEARFRTSRDAGRRGGVFLSLGFRPFFFAAGLFAVLAMAIWILAWHGSEVIAPSMGARNWHVHEMIFGYGSAVVSGFLFTAVPNWTGRPAVSGSALAGLFLLWLAGRIVLLFSVPPVWAAVIDVIYLPVMALVLAREILGAGNRRNLVVLAPLMLFALANILFHVEVARQGTAGSGMRLGLGGLVFLVMVIGGRIVPAFTRNWLMQQRADRQPAVPGRFDLVALLLGGAALLFWVVQPMGWFAGAVLGLAGILHLVRLARWCGFATLPNPLLLVLHLGYATVPAGLLLLALAAMQQDFVTEVAALHMFGVGVIGAMTLSVMVRVCLGHSGRPLRSDGWMNAAFGLVFGAALVRVLAPLTGFEGPMIDLAALLWIAAFALFLLRIGPLLFRPRLGGQG